MYKAQKDIDKLTVYCKANPCQRFWQALRNFTNNQYIIFRNINRKGEKIDVDTFYKEEL